MIARCWCGRRVAVDVVDPIECAEHDRPPTPITDVLTFPQVSSSPGCGTCGGDGFLFHLFAGAVELDGPCPDCTGKAAA